MTYVTISWSETQQLHGERFGKKWNLPPNISNYLPIHGNPMFPQSSENQAYTTWKAKNLTNASSFIHKGIMKLKPFSELVATYMFPQSHMLYYHQTASYTTSCSKNTHSNFKPSLIEDLITQKNYSISTTYKLLQINVNSTSSEDLFGKWKEELRTIDSVDNILRGYLKIRKITINKAWRETQFKLIHKAYIPALFLRSTTHKTTCPQCGQHKLSLAHRLWHCPWTSFFWDQVTELFKNVIGLNIPNSPHLMLFWAQSTCTF